MRRLAVMWIVMAACSTEGDLCDRDQTYSHGLCYEIDSGVFDHFGDACTVDADCGAPATTCAREGYCTKTGCTSNEECPVFWTCETQSGAGELPHICVQH